MAYLYLSMYKFEQHSCYPVKPTILSTIHYGTKNCNVSCESNQWTTLTPTGALWPKKRNTDLLAEVV
jgi:hypothetical protein